MEITARYSFVHFFYRILFRDKYYLKQYINCMIAVRIRYQAASYATAKKDRRHAKCLNTAAGIRGSGTQGLLKAAGSLLLGHKSKEGTP